MTAPDSQRQADAGIHVTSEVTEQQYADGGLMISEAHTRTACPGSSIGEAGCTLTLPARTAGQARRHRQLVRHLDLRWLTARHQAPANGQS